MKCHKARRMMVVGERSEWVTAHLHECPSCAEWAVRDERLRRLLQAHRASDVEAASLQAQTRLRQGVLAQVERARREFSRRWFPTLSLPLARYAIAAVFIGMITFHWIVSPSPQPLVQEAPMPMSAGWRMAGPSPSGPFAPRSSEVPDASINIPPAWAEGSPVFVTNVGAAGLHYGLGRRFIQFQE